MDPLHSLATLFAPFASLRPAIAIHLAAALSALCLGPFILWRRKGTPDHKRLGRLWGGLMLTAAVSSLFIRDFHLPNIAGYTPIHLLTALTFFGVIGGVLWARRGQMVSHQKAMRGTFWGGCVGAGLFALAPGRFLGQWLWHHALGWL